MHKTVYFDENGIMRLFEFNLSLPQKGTLAKLEEDFNGARGFEVLGETKNGYVVPMFKMSGELHYLWSSNAILYDKYNKPIKTIKPAEMQDEKGLEKLLSHGQILSADHPLDTHTLLDDMGKGMSFAQCCDEDLRETVNKVLNAKNKPFEYDSVLIMTNSGVGDSTDINSNNDGVIRDENGFSYARRSKDKVSVHYERGLPNSYQNTGKTHFHIIPIPKGIENELTMTTINQIQSIHGVNQIGTLYEYRKMLQKTRQNDVGTISITIADKNSLESPLNFIHYSSATLHDEAKEQLIMSSFAGSTIRKLYGELRNIDLNDKKGVGQLRKFSTEFYKNNIK